MKKTEKYSPEVMQRAVRLVFEAKEQHPSEWAAIVSIAANLGCSAETLRRWVRRHQRDTGQREGLPTAERDRLKALEREVRELRKANEILRLASAFFAQAELNKPIDGGHYLFTTEERDSFIQQEPASAPWFRRWLGSEEFINGKERWCLWLGNCPPNQLRAMPMVLERIEAVRAFRSDSRSAPTRKLANTPTRFHVENMPATNYLVIPEVSSERRLYIPVGFLGPETLASNLVKIAANATQYHFGILSSAMHMAWTRTVCGRLKSDYRYSVGIVYNNFPWPDPSDTQRAAVETAAQAVLDARALYPTSTLADLYDPRTMPAALVKAHQQLDRAVDAAYSRKKFSGDSDRVAFLFERYQALTAS